MSSSPDSNGRRRKPLLVSVVIVALIVMGSSMLMYFEHQQDMQEYYNYKVALFEEENKRYSEYEVDVAFLGDSITDGCDLPTYYPEFVCANRGIGGDTTFGLERRLDVSLYQLKPKIAVILIGTNNIDSMLDNYEDIVLGIKENTPRTEIVLCGLTPTSDFWKDRNYPAAYNNVVIKKLAQKHGCTFVDLFTPLFDERSGMIYADCTVEGLHLNHKGYTIVSGEINPVLHRLLDDWKAT